MADEPEVVVEAPESETEITDESVNVTIISPPTVEPVAELAPPAPVEAHCEHCAEHAAALAELRAAVAALAAAEAAEPEPEPAPAAPEPEPEPEPDVAPKRVHPLHAKLFSRREE